MEITVNSWETAIAKAKIRMKELELAIQVFEMHKELGIPWNADEKAGTSAESVPA
jgi:hypothetical protein